jgi:two-component sensor histidine kinase
LQQVLNTLAPWGTPLPKTGDAKTVLRVRDTQQPQVSNYLVGVVSQKPSFDVDIPIIRDGTVQYVMMLGLAPEHLLPILHAQTLGPEWISAVVDRNGIVLARTRNNADVSGRAHSSFTEDLTVDRRGLVTSKALEGEEVLRAGVRSQLSGWRVMCSVPIAIAEAPLRRSLQQWGAAAALALALTLAAAWWLGRAMERPLSAASEAATALGRGDPIEPLQSSIAEANGIVAALKHASAQLSSRADQQRVLMQELSHRIKNIISVIRVLASRTLSEEHSIAEARATLLERLQSLARAHELLIGVNWGAAPLKALVAAELAPFAKRAVVSGPEVFIEAEKVQTFAMVLHELATNAAKHGALSTEQGTVAVTWSVEGSGTDQRFRLRWEEAGGPPVASPTRKGFGTVLLQDALASDKITINASFAPQGLVYQLEGRLADVGVQVE